MLLCVFVDVEGVWWYLVLIDSVLLLYLQVLLIYEDCWFWCYLGINLLVILCVSGQLLCGGCIVFGGLILIMQVVCIFDLYLCILWGKLKQMLCVVQFEVYLSKQQILVLYLECVFYGGIIEGVEVVSWVYLGKLVVQLLYVEVVLLVVLLQVLSWLCLDCYLEVVQKVCDKVLLCMVELGVWILEEVEDVCIENVVVCLLWLFLYVVLLVQCLYVVYLGQVCIQSSIDIGLQCMLEECVVSYFLMLFECILVVLLVVDNWILQVCVYVGILFFGDCQWLGYVDMVQVWCLLGFMFKLFLYVMVLDDGLIYLESLLVDVLQSFGSYCFGNFDMVFNGFIGVFSVLWLLFNVLLVDLLQWVGVVCFVVWLLYVGIQLCFLLGSMFNLLLILGGIGVCLEDLVGVFVVFNWSGIVGCVCYIDDEFMIEWCLVLLGVSWIVCEMFELNL